MSLFFPSSAFAWVFSGGLLALLTAASWTDLRRMVVPKSITLTTLIVGVLANMARGAWLGWAGLRVWAFDAGGGCGPGALDGLLFAVCGTAAAFGVMFGIWLLGTCGGGDVKLYAAVGAWVGPRNILAVLAVAAVILALMGMGGLVLRLLRGKVFRRPTVAGKPPRSRLVTFSLPLAAATLLVLAFLLGNDVLTLRAAARSIAPQGQSETR